MKNIYFIPLFALPLAFIFYPRNTEKKTESNKVYSDSILPKKDTSLQNIRPVMLATDPKTGKSIPLRISNVDISVEVRGNRATTTLDMKFINETNRILEGALTFPMGEGQTISRFALEVNGDLREGVVIEKEKGQEVFEKVIRQNVDPGLLEHTQGNNYKARVYPIPSKGKKRLVIAYEQDLLYSTEQWLYLLPLDFPERLDSFTLKAKVYQQDIQPKNSANELENLKFEKWEEHYIAELCRGNYLANKQIGFTVPVPENYPKVLTGKADGKNYFYTVVNPHPQERKKPLPTKISLLWDVSGSGVKMESDFKLLDAYIKTIGNLTIHPILFSNKVHDHFPEYKITNGNWDELKDFLLSQRYDGATQLGNLDLKKYSTNEFLLFSDGLSNFGKDEIKLGSAPVICISSSQNADFNYLKRLAMQSGGQFINLNNTSLNEASKKITQQDYHFIRADFDKGVITETYPSVPVSVNNIFGYSGLYTGVEGQVVLHFGYGQQITESVKVSIPKEEKSDPSIKRIWSWNKIKEMELMYPEDEKTLTAFAKENNLVTRFTSLIVLDRLEDYVEHKIIPPGEMKKEYFAQINSQKKEEKKQHDEHLQSVIDLFKTRINWYNTDFMAINNEKEDKKYIHTDSSDILQSIEAGSISLSHSEVDDLNPLRRNGFANEAITYSFSTDATNGLNNGSFKTESQSDFPKNSIKLKEWNPDVPYIAELKKLPKERVYQKYLEQKEDYKSSPSFFLDVSDYLTKLGYKDTALCVLSNLAEMDLKNPQMMRVLAHRLEQLGYYDLAIDMFRKVLEIRSEEPQSYRDLGLALSLNGNDQEAIDVLYKVVEKTWDTRFPEIEVLVMTEVNTIISNSKKTLNTSAINSELLKAMPCDMRVILTWDTDNCDMDLWVTDPKEETCKYNNNETQIGGRMSRDFTGGYGPEEFLIHKAMKGKYKVQINYYGTREQTLLGPTTIQVKMINNYGTPYEKVQEVTRRLSNKQEVLDIGDCLFQ